MLFNIAFERITPESAEHGDAAEIGMHAENVSLRAAFDMLAGADTIEANECPIVSPHWLTFYGIEENYQTGETVNMSLHFPRHMTPASRRRLCKLFRVYGWRHMAAAA